ncbi:MAG: hypothetical protein ACOCYE_07175 [Pseudomonadota bacterium]
MEYSAARALSDVAVIYAIVIVVSLSVAVVIRLIVGTLSRRADRTAAVAARLRPAEATAALPNGIPPHHLVAIAAAVGAMAGAHRIVRIEPRRSNYGWTATGRTLHHGSHHPRHR